MSFVSISPNFIIKKEKKEMANYICKAGLSKALNCDGNCSKCSSARKDNYTPSASRVESTIVPSYYMNFIPREDRRTGKVQSI